MGRLKEKLIGKTILRCEKSKILDYGFKILFTDGSTLEIAYNNFEGCTNFKEKDDVKIT